VVPHVLELDDQLFAQLVVDDGYRQGRGLVGQEAAIVGSLQMQLEILQGLALHQVQVVGLLQDAALEAPAQTLQISIIDIHYRC